MRRDEAIELIQRHTSLLKDLGVKRLFLYGSTARDEAKEGSDIDLFIDYDQSRCFSLVDLIRVQQYLADATGTTIDLLTRDSLHPLLRERIQSEAIGVF